MSRVTTTCVTALALLVACTTQLDTDREDPAAVPEQSHPLGRAPDARRDDRRDHDEVDRARTKHHRPHACRDDHGRKRPHDRCASWGEAFTLDRGDITGFALSSGKRQRAYLTWGRDCGIHARAYARGGFQQAATLPHPEGDCAIAPRATLDADEYAVAAWLAYPKNEPTRTPASVWALRYAIDDPSAAVPVQLDPSVPHGPPAQRVAAVHVDRARRALVLWTTMSGDTGSFEAALSSDGSRFTTLSPLLRLSRGYTVRGDVFTRDVEAGSTLVFWHGALYTHPNYPEDALFSRRLSAAGTWEGADSEPYAISKTISGAAFAVARDGQSGVALFGQVQAAGSPGSVMARTYAAGAWSASTEPVASVATPGGVDLAVANDGETLAVFVSERGLEAATRRDGHFTEAAQPIATVADGSTITNPQVAVDAEGHAAAVWLRHPAGSAPGETEVWASERPRGTDAWRTPERLGRGDRAVTDGIAASASNTSAVPRLAMLGDGRALAVWAHWQAPGAVELRAARLD